MQIKPQLTASVEQPRSYTVSEFLKLQFLNGIKIITTFIDRLKVTAQFGFLSQRCLHLSGISTVHLTVSL